jgi:hypothetical protein
MKRTTGKQTKITHHFEAFSRVLIDKALTESGWDIVDPELQTSSLRASRANRPCGLHP